MPTWVDLCTSPGTSPGGRAPLAWTRQLGAVPEVVFQMSVAGARGCRTQTFISKGPGPVCVTITDSRPNHLISFLVIPPLGPDGACTHGSGVPEAATISSVGISARTPQPKDPRAAGTRSHWWCCHPWILPSGHTVLYRGLCSSASMPNLHLVSAVHGLTRGPHNHGSTLALLT